MLPLRKAGLARFAERGYPTTNDEDWRFTSLKSLTDLPFLPTLEPLGQALGLADIAEITFGQHDVDRLVFVDGHFSSDLSVISEQPDGVTVTNLSSSLNGLENEIGSLSANDENPFIGLNDAFFTDGALIRIPANGRLAKLAHPFSFPQRTKPAKRHTSETGSRLAPTRRARSSSRTYRLAKRRPAPTSSPRRASTPEPTSSISNFRISRSTQIHLASLHSELSDDARYAFHSFALGARLSRNNLRMRLAKPGIECVLNGLYMTRANQLADHHMIVDHAAPHCDSHEYFNGILDDQSRGVFHGRILVQPVAQKTDAKQTNKKLILSDNATANTKPQLEIYADDVKCTHGATIGEMDDDAIFYLRARGLDTKTARRMLMHGFAGEIVDRIQHDGIREELDELVWNRLEGEHHLD